MRTQLLLGCALLGALGPAWSRDIAELVPLGTIRLGATADWVAITPDAVWVGSTGPSAVHRIDPDHTALSRSVALPGEPCAGLAAGLGALWVPLCAAKQETGSGLAKIDLKSGELVAVYPVAPAGAEGGVAVSGDSVWLLLDARGTLARIDPTSGAVRSRLQLAPGSYNPHDVAGTLYVTQALGTALSRVETTSGKLAPTLEVGANPRFLTHGAGAVWTLNQGDGSVSRIDLNSGAIEHIGLDTPGHGGDIAFGAGYLFSTMMKVPLSVIDPATRRVLCQWRGPGGDSLGIGFGAVWLTDYHAGTVSRYALKETLRRCTS